MIKKMCGVSCAALFVAACAGPFVSIDDSLNPPGGLVEAADICGAKLEAFLGDYPNLFTVEAGTGMHRLCMAEFGYKQ